MKRTIPLFISAVTGFVLIGTAFIPKFVDWGNDAMAWFNILAAFAFILGGGNLLKMQLQKISSQQPGWGYAAVTLIAFFITLVAGLFKIGVYPNVNAAQLSWSGDFLQEGSFFWWLYEYIYNPLSATMFALLAFYISSAAFRAFRAKNSEATVLLVIAVIVLLGRTYAGEWLTGGLSDENIPGFQEVKYSDFSLPHLSQIIMDVFTTPGMRAITIGIALGVASTSLKVLLGVDRSYLGSDQEA
ncbi:hypothetical protein Pan153_41240 [Gimesia panareensis]|uniref:Uncharacterized protein n=1 Tax=Gimesia panareensis TaxID=2527978 RepID=A0A518FSY9_9PLAN|nr:hypothetical protein [Gimesia panareensis]QDV19459.1 hypothetical protein Pan153_41240 [Gimesia panareensis]